MNIMLKKILASLRHHWKRWGIIAVVLLLVFSMFRGCSSTAQKEYELDTASTRTLEELVSVVGSVESDQDLDLSFKRGGAVGTVNVTEGQQVFSGALLAELDVDDLQIDVESKKAMLALEETQLDKLRNGLRQEDVNLLDTNIHNAELSLDALNASIASSKTKHQRQLDESKLSMENAKTQYEQAKSAQTVVNTADVNTATLNLENAKKNLGSIEATNDANVKAAEARLKEAEVALSNAKSALETGKPIQDKGIEDAEINAFYDATRYLDDIDRSLRAVNGIITVEDYNKGQNGAYVELLGVLKVNSYSQVVEDYKVLKSHYENQKNLFEITSNVLSYDEILSRLSTLKDLLNESSKLLGTTSDMLNNSVTSTDFPVSALDAFKASILTQKDSVATTLSALSSTKLKVETLELQRTNQVSSLDNAVTAAQASYDSAQQNLVSVKTSATTNLINAQNAVATAQENLARTQGQSDSRENDIDKLRQAYEQSQKQYATLQASLAETEAGLEKNRTDLTSQLSTAKAQKVSQAAPAREEDVRAEEERVKQARLSLELAENNLRDAQIRAPRSGVISKVNYKVGESIGANQPMFTMISDEVDSITTLVAETEIAKVKVGQPVRMDFDAFSEDDIYTGEVRFINPNKTAQDGVIYYETKISFDPHQIPMKEVRPGFSANISIITNTKDTLGVSNIAIKSKDGNNYVDLVTGHKGDQVTYQETQVDIGMEGENNTEILSGLQEGDEVVLSVKDKTN